MYTSIQIENFYFNLEKISIDEINNYKNKFNEIYLKPLESYLLDSQNQIFSADKIQEDFFPQIDADIFLSHAHNDEDDIIKLAIYLEENFKIKVFVDSCIWGNVYQLLKSINDKYCKIDEDLYSYQGSIYASTNIYMILNTALHNMIDRTEIFLFLGTKESIKINDIIEGTKESVRSPWIYSELMFAKQVKRQSKYPFIGLESFSESKTIMDSMPTFNYNKPDLDYCISSDTFYKWLKNAKNKEVHDIIREFYHYLESN
ncbi:hypothetical protein KMU_00650 [Proteus vulgaris]|uniref:hypothetical protein n=1 Tax=Proteus vulgaris TaxID=585 RepID=UPI0025554EDF|nr:hypothetical protein [Proteus vulgaris]GLX62025.1 hypothetical protein KMU_00650 [Proteus vulgaris]